MDLGWISTTPRFAEKWWKHVSNKLQQPRYRNSFRRFQIPRRLTPHQRTGFSPRAENSPGKQGLAGCVGSAGSGWNFSGNPGIRCLHPKANCFGSKPMGSHFGVAEFTTQLRTYFSGDWDVHWGYGLLTHGQMTLPLRYVTLLLFLYVFPLRNIAQPALPPSFALLSWIRGLMLPETSNRGHAHKRIGLGPSFQIENFWKLWCRLIFNHQKGTSKRLLLSF